MNKGTQYYHKNSDVVAYVKIEYSDGSWSEATYDENGDELTYKTSNGFYEIKGELVTKEEFEKFINRRPCVGKVVTIDGVEYTLK